MFVALCILGFSHLASNHVMIDLILKSCALTIYVILHYFILFYFSSVVELVLKNITLNFFITDAHGVFCGIAAVWKIASRFPLPCGHPCLGCMHKCSWSFCWNIFLCFLGLYQGDTQNPKNCGCFYQVIWNCNHSFVGLLS